MDLYDLLEWDWLLSSCTEHEDEEQCDCTPAERGLSSRVQFEISNCSDASHSPSGCCSLCEADWRWVCGEGGDSSCCPALIHFSNLKGRGGECKKLWQSGKNTHGGAVCETKHDWDSNADLTPIKLACIAELIRREAQESHFYICPQLNMTVLLNTLSIHVRRTSNA